MANFGIVADFASQFEWTREFVATEIEPFDFDNLRLAELIVGIYPRSFREQGIGRQALASVDRALAIVGGESE